MSLRLALEIGGTKFQAALGEAGGRIIRADRCGVRGDLDEQVSILEALARKVLAGEAVERVGIGFGGPVNLATGRVVLSHHVAGWGDFPLVEWAQRNFGVPCAIENDTNAGALAEATLGAGRGGRVVVYSNIGSGIGGGLVIDGRLHNGRLGAFEIGHTKLWDKESGQYVIVEHLCSGWSINRIARQRAAAGAMPRVLALAGGEVAAISAEQVGRAASAGDEPARELVREVAENYAIALCNVITLVNPDRVVIGGGVSLMGDVFFQPLRAAVARQVFDLYRDNYQILPAGLGENVVLVGALLL